MAVVPTQQPAHNENEHASCELKLELKGHTSRVLIIKKILLNYSTGATLLFLT